MIDETGGLTIDKLAARARRVARREGVDLILVDYLQLMQGTTRDGRVQDMARITAGFKALAKELGVPVLLISQLSRQVEQRDNKRPQLSDLRESGTIEQDADVILLMFREEYYVSRQEPPSYKHDEYARWKERMEAVKGRAEIIIGKDRAGGGGLVRLGFESEFATFVDAEVAP
jgi:replicative DNA helicase